MARFEKLQDLFDALWRTREARSLASLCDELGASPATVNRLIPFPRDQRELDIQYDRNLNGYRLERGPENENAAVLLGLSGQEISAILEAEALFERIPPGFMRSETKAVRARLDKARRHPLGRSELKDRVRRRMSQLRSTAADASTTVLAALRARQRPIARTGNFWGRPIWVSQEVKTVAKPVMSSSVVRAGPALSA